MELEHVLIQTINDTELLYFIQRHKERLNKPHDSEINLRKEIYKCVESDLKDGRLIHHTFNIVESDSEDYSIRAEYMNSIPKKDYFLVESFIRDNEYVYKTHECTVVGCNNTNSIVEYKDSRVMLSSIVPNHRLFPLSDKEAFEKRSEDLNKKRKEVINLESKLYNYE